MGNTLTAGNTDLVTIPLFAWLQFGKTSLRSETQYPPHSRLDLPLGGLGLSAQTPHLGNGAEGGSPLHCNSLSVLLNGILDIDMGVV